MVVHDAGEAAGATYVLCRYGTLAALDKQFRGLGMHTLLYVLVYWVHITYAIQVYEKCIQLA